MCEVWEKATRQKATKEQAVQDKAATLDGSLEKMVKGGRLMECGWEKLDSSKTDEMVSDNKEEGEGSEVDNE